MVSRKESKRAKEYIASRFLESDFQVKDTKEGLFLVENSISPQTFHLYFHKSRNGAEEVKHDMHKRMSNGDNVANIFYKDETNFFVPLCSAWKIPQGLKKYDLGEVKSSIRISDKEKEVLRLQGFQRLAYYQPDNHDNGGRLSEGLISFKMVPLYPNYNHIHPEDQRYDFARSQEGQKYKLRKKTTDKKVLEDRLLFLPSREGSKVFVIGSEENLDERGKISRKFGFPTSGDHLKAFLDQTGTKLEDWGDIGDIELYINPQ